jgi:protein phosphatase 1G
MGQYLSAPVTAKESDRGENRSLKFGMASMQGWRVCMVRLWLEHACRRVVVSNSTSVLSLSLSLMRPVPALPLCSPSVTPSLLSYYYITVQEDAHIASLDLGDEHGTGLFAVFDGHGGKLVAKYAAKHLPRALHSTDHFAKHDADLGLAFAEAFYRIDEELDTPEGMQELRDLAGAGHKNSASQVLFGDVQGIELDGEDNGDDDTASDGTGGALDGRDRGDTLGKSPEREASSRQFVESALARDSVIKVDQVPDQVPSQADDVDVGDDFAEHKASGMGCTAVAAMIRNGEVTVANTGDSRCVISRNGVAEPLTLDHKPVLLKEAERIMNAGGFVRDNRVNGALNVSRTLGDLDFKRNRDLPHTHQMVVATPDITSFDLKKGDEFVILACDGIWDVMSNQEAVDFVRKRIKAGQDLMSICEDMCDHCLAPNLQGMCRGADNMSVIVVLFKETAELGTIWNSLKRLLRISC